jgi:predicted DNA-binding antitoxin AbrB/MazE fold protein
MGKRIQAVYDGAVLRPAEPLTLEPNTEVWVTIEDAPPAEEATASFLKTARALNLEGPADWSARLEDYLYGGKVADGR